MTRDLPAGTVTLVFTDVEGSTRLLHELGAANYEHALAEHRRWLRDAFARHGGVEVDTQGDAFFVAFPTALGAVAAAREAQAALADGPIRVRIGMHTGTPHLGEDGYIGTDVHRAARIAAAAHGGQVVLSNETRTLIEADVTDLGEHRLKDFDAAVPLFQLGSDRFPPLKTISSTNLPRPVSSFVGREREVAEISVLVRDGTRLLTLTGPGGTGKTRLAIEAASALVPEFKAGVFWIPLAALRDPALVADTIGQTLGAKDGLAQHIGDRELLLLLDNLEQVVEAAPELASLLESCPNLRLLATSRELLRVRGELEYPVPPLVDPEAVELFCQRARVEPDHDVRALCRALDNLPLALELAAARATVLTPEQILERLSQRLDVFKGARDADPRQRTLRATIEWSYELLSPEEQRLFADLAVFRGGWTLEAAEQVGEADLDTLGALVDKSLVRRRPDRFWMLETIREFATERLEGSGRADALRRRHADHFLALAEEAYPHLRSHPKPWLDRLEKEHDNLRAALDRLEVAGAVEEALRLAGALSRFWYLHGYIAEGRRRLEALLRPGLRPTAALGRALNGAAVMAVDNGDTAAARVRAEEALAVHRELGDPWGTAYSLYMIGTAAAEERAFSRAQPFFEDSLKRFGELGDEHYVLLATDALAWTYGELGDRDRRRALHEDVLRHARAQGDDGVAALQLDQLAHQAVEEGRVDDAVSMLRESLRSYVDLGLLGGMVENFARYALVLVAQQRLEAAAELLARAEALREEIGGLVPWVADLNQETLGTIRSQLDQATFAAACERGRRLSLEETIARILNAPG